MRYTSTIGHVHLKVRDLPRSIAFYTEFVGLQVTEQLGNQFVFMSGGDSHHELALQALGPQAPGAPPDSVGLFHTAFEVQDKETLHKAFLHLQEQGVPVSPVDHMISWALYFNDPDGNGLELYCDTRKDTDVALWNGVNRAIDWEVGSVE